MEMVKLRTSTGIIRSIEFEREQKRQERAIADKQKSNEEEPKESARKLTYNEKKEMQKLEKEMEKMESRKAEIYEAFNDTSLASDAIENLSKELGQIQKDLEDKEMRWMELAEFA